MDRADKRKGGLKVPKTRVELRIKRSNLPGQESAQESIFILEYHAGMTLQSALEHIYARLDSSLGFRPYRCGKGICGSCLVSVNGRRKKACTTFLKPGDRLVIGPDPFRPLIRDLVTIPSKSGPTLSAKGDAKTGEHKERM
jgi:succinate dehydrogenase/fumarate reductase-like Fe-S protein